MPLRRKCGDDVRRQRLRRRLAGASTCRPRSVPPFVSMYARLPNAAGVCEKPEPRSTPSMGRPFSGDSENAPYRVVPTSSAPAMGTGAVMPPSGTGTRQTILPVGRVERPQAA